MKRSRPGFTLVEVLVVVVIIAILMSMAMIAFKTLNHSVASRATRVTLTNLKSMLAELDTTATIAAYVEGPKQLTIPATPLPVYFLGAAIPQPGNVSDGVTSGTNVVQNRFSPPFFDPVVGNPSTDLVLAQMIRIPKNNSSLLSLPSRQLMVIPTPPVPASATTQPPPLVLDAWSNPVLFVPSGGLTGVSLNSNPGGTFTVRSSGVYAETNGVAQPPTSKDRPFWASAGPDGDFSKGDDNIYSFED